MTLDDKTPFPMIFALWAAGLGAAAQFAKISVIFPQLAAHYPEAEASLGFLLSLASFLGIVLGLVAGLIISRVGYRKMLLPALALGAVLSIYQSTLPAFPLMLFSRLLEGLSHLTIVVAAPTMIAQISAERHRPFTMTLWSTFFGLSFALVAWLGLPLVAAYGMPSLFIAHAIFMVMVAAVLYFFLPSLPSSALEQSRISLRGIIDSHIIAYRSPFIAAPAIGWLFYTLTFVSMLTILPTLVPAEDRSFAAGAMPLAGMAVSMTVGVMLLRYISAVRMITIGFALSALIVASFIWVPISAPICVLLIGALGLVQSGSFASVPQLNSGATEQALANGSMAQMGNVGNTIGTPILLWALVTFGNNGLVVFTVVCFAAGIAAHFLHQTRRTQLG